LNVTVTVRFAVKFTEHGFTLPPVSQFDQLPKVEVPAGVAVRVTVVPLANCAEQAFEQPNPDGTLVTVPVPAPEKLKLRIGAAPPPPPPLPVPVKHTTLPVMNPVTNAPEEEIPPELLPVVIVAEIRLAPHASPVTVSTPDESTVIICGVLEVQVTWLVMSLVTGG
jgi:hypothetical protein